MVNQISQDRIKNEINLLELKSYRVSTLLGTIILNVYGFLISLILIFSGVGLGEALAYLGLFLLVSGAGFILWWREFDLSVLKKMSYVSIFFVYVFITYLLFNSNLPGIYANIFLGFTLGYLYLDVKATWINHILMALSSSILIWVFPDLFSLEGLTFINRLLVNVIVFVLLIFLFFSSYFSIRRKGYDYLRLAKLKENEYKIIEVLMNLESDYFSQKNDSSNMYQTLKEFFVLFSKKVGVENIFEKRLELIQDSQILKDEEFQDKYPEIHLEVKEYSQTMSIDEKAKLRFLAFKLSQIENIEIDYSMNQEVFNSLRHYEDDKIVKLVVFSAFLVFFRIDKLELKGLTTQEFITLLKQSDVENKIEPRILELFYQYQDVIDDIIADATSGGVNL
jgi:hypothetical protein